VQQPEAAEPSEGGEPAQPAPRRRQAPAPATASAEPQRVAQPGGLPTRNSL
jgi:hypothetical protein